MGSCIIEKFSHYADLTDAEKKYLQKLEDTKIDYKAGDKIRSKGDGFEDIYVIHNGWTYVSSNLDKNVRTIFDVRMSSDFVGVSELGDSSVNLAVRPHTHPTKYWDVYFGTLENCKNALDKGGITIPFPQVDVHMDK